MQIDTLKYRNQLFYSIKIDSKDPRVAKIKAFPGRLWSQSAGLWLLPYKDRSKDFLDTIRDHEKDGEERKENAFYVGKMQQKLQEMSYSSSTIRTYLTMFTVFLKSHSRYSPLALEKSDIQAYLKYLIEEKKVSQSYQNQMINAIKFYYEKIVGRNDYTDIVTRPKTNKVIPDVLTKEETLLLLKSINNIKHKTITMVIYSSGLRIGELLSVKTEDVDFEKSTIFIQKRRRNRYVHLAQKTSEVLQEYLAKAKPSEFLFEGQKGQEYTASSVQKFLRKYCKELEINKKITPQSLRHSYAVHLLENGADVRYVQKTLDYSSKKATEIYSEITDALKPRIVNPIDLLEM